MLTFFLVGIFNDLKLEVIEKVTVYSPCKYRDRVYYWAEMKEREGTFNYYLRDDKFKTLIHFQTPYRVRKAGVIPFDTSFSLIINFVRNDTLFIRRVSLDRRFTKEYFVMKGEDTYKMEKGWDAGLRFFYYEVKDGDTLLYGRLDTYWDANERGFIIYSLKKEKLIFYYKTGPLLRHSLMADVDGDGVKDFVSGSYAVHNGCELNGTSDKDSYIFAVSPVKGLLYRIQTTSDYYAETKIDTFSERGKIYLIAHSLYTESERGKEDSLKIFSLNGKLIKARKTGIRTLCPAVYKDLDFDMKPEIVIWDEKGRVRVFNTNLELIIEKDLREPIKSINIFDMDGDGEREVVVCCKNRKVLILNRKLKKLLEHDLKYLKAREVDFLYGQEEGKKQIMFNIITEDGLIYSAIFVPIFSYEKIINIKALFTLFGFVSLFFITFLLLLYRRNKNFTNILLENDDRGILFITRKNTIKRMNRKAKDIIKNKNVEIIDGEDGGKFIKFGDGEEWELKRIHNRIWYIYDEEERKYRYIIKKWIPNIQRVVHDMKNTISLIDLTVKKDKKDIDKYIKRLFEQTVLFLNLSKITHLNKKRYDVVKILKNIIEEYNSVLREQKLIAQFDVERYDMNIDKDKFESALRNLIKNALEATEKKGKVYVKTGIENLVDEKEIISKNFVITIEDTGKGMSKEELKNIFSLNFSRKKKGSGVGLGIAKTVIELHKGEIDVVSEKGKGTIITLRFKHG